MRTVRLCWFLTLLLSALAYPAGAAIRPSFSLDSSTWHATNIVLVATTSNDTVFEVVESWKGDLRVGERIVIPELRPSPDAVPISAYPRSWEEADPGKGSELIPKEPTGSRMILFLKSRTFDQVPKNTLRKTEHSGWEPSDLLGSMKASAVWIYGDQLYSFAQFFSPGPSVLSRMPDSEIKIRSRVKEIIGMQDDISVALAVKDGHERAERLKPYVRAEIFPVQQFALEQLGKVGPSGVPTIQEMLNDPAFADEASELIEALVRAGGNTIGEDLNRRLQRELAFWRTTAPSLPEGWWNTDARIHAPLRERYGETYQLLVGIEQIHYSPALNTVTQLRDFWRSLPQLDDPTGLNQIAEECDKLIRSLQPEIIKVD